MEETDGDQGNVARDLMTLVLFILSLSFLLRMLGLVLKGDPLAIIGAFAVFLLGAGRLLLGMGLAHVEGLEACREFVYARYAFLAFTTVVCPPIWVGCVADSPVTVALYYGGLSALGLTVLKRIWLRSWPKRREILAQCGTIAIIVLVSVLAAMVKNHVDLN